MADNGTPGEELDQNEQKQVDLESTKQGEIKQEEDGNVAKGYQGTGVDDAREVIAHIGEDSKATKRGFKNEASTAKGTRTYGLLCQ